MKMITLRCPACGADVEAGSDRAYCFCSYCGTKIMLQNENEYIYRHIDEAGVAEEETDRMIRLRELELEEREKKADNIKIAAVSAVSILLVVIGIIGFSIHNAGMEMCMLFAMLVALYGFIAFDDKREAYEKRAKMRSGKIRLSGGNSLKGKNVEFVQQRLRALGFRNIRLIPMNDLTNSLFIKPGKVKSVIIDGKEEFDSEEWFTGRAMVTVIYHSMR